MSSDQDRQGIETYFEAPAEVYEPPGSSDQDRQKLSGRNKLRDVLYDALSSDYEITSAGYRKAADAVIANVETVIRAAGGEVRTERHTEPAPLLRWLKEPPKIRERTVYVMPWEKVAADEQR